MMMDTSSMAPDQVAYIQLQRAEILKKRLGESLEMSIFYVISQFVTFIYDVFSELICSPYYVIFNNV